MCVTLRLRDEVVDVLCVTLRHGALEGGSIIFEAKGNNSVGECAPWSCECHLVTVFFLDLDLVVSGKTINEGEGFMSGTCIDDLVDERCGEVVFRTCPIEITEVYANANSTLFFIDGNRIRNPSCVCNGINEVGCAHFSISAFTAATLDGWMGHCF